MSKFVLKEAFDYAGDGIRLEAWMPADARVVAFQGQRGTPTLWYETSNLGPVEQRTFVLAYTGSEQPAGNEYLGTTQMPDGIVVHLYETPMRRRAHEDLVSSSLR